MILNSSFVVIVLFSIPQVNSNSKYPKLLVVSFDGFRYDYLDRGLTPVLNSLKSSSTYAKCLLNVFPTQTFPNHFTIATGLYTEVHGVLANKVYDKKTHQVLTDAYDLWHYNRNITPIWTLNEKAGGGRHSGVMMWPGSSFEYNGIRPTFVMRFNQSHPWQRRVDTLIGWFLHSTTPANLVMLYFEEPDVDSHIFGPDSEENKQQIRRNDQLTEYLMSNLKKNNLTDVNIVFLSDHGMESVTKDRLIDLRDYVGEEVDMYGTSPVLQIYPKKGVYERVVFEKLYAASLEDKHFKVYLQDDIPDHFFYKKCQRTPPILAVAEPPYAFQDKFASIKKYMELYNASENGTIGIHGYDPRTVTMHAYFMAHGPAFRQNYSAPALRTIDMFPLFADILDLELPTITPNGSLANLQHILAPSSGHRHFILHVLFFCIICFIFKHFKKKQRKERNKKLLMDVWEN